jgi:HNH endonuclease
MGERRGLRRDSDEGVKMTERKPLSRAVRFEVFKRDAFTCQYCGAKAPDVVLEVDHVKPLAEGGDDSLLNLVTSCKACNGGKGARSLDDDSVLAKQRAQIEELHQRRQQIEMMLQWRDDALAIEKLKADKIVDAINAKSEEWELSESGRQMVERWVRKFPFDEILSAVDIAFDQYFRGDGASWSHAIDKISGIITIKHAAEGKPYLPRLFYARGILRKRLGRIPDAGLMSLLTEAAEAGADVEGIVALARSCTSFARFQRALIDFLEEREEEGSS